MATQCVFYLNSPDLQKLILFLGLDTKSESCQRFIKDGMTISFNKIFLDDAVSTWKFEIHVSFIHAFSHSDNCNFKWNMS